MPGPKKPQPPPSQPLARLFHLLSSFQTTDEIRTYLIADMRSGHNFCLSCSPAGLPPGTCNRTCVLLSPHKYAPIKLDPTWLSRAMRDQTMYRDVLTEIKACGGNASEQKIAEWEGKIGRLMRWAMNETERREAMGWKEGKGWTAVTGMDAKWVFEAAWRIRAVDEVEAALEGMMSPGHGKSGQGKKRKVLDDGEVLEIDEGRFTRSKKKRQKIARAVKGIESGRRG
ncbi:hypothetical protein HBI26_186800 [Parastagonospora nodorum]|nr:hypothetical protein HBH50_074240 [Parastagonospora nodorum]KAH4082591.1 hypothetical protein HBH46_220390 [Parastagonospora nodorum]KAH4095107.1 hypothetical protein HBH48_062510 [Parastagonospora nodorum]KAH4856152.1 hypothetical protein HBH75_073500 [Parastagonospora nodorum]KAH4903766.1 hypothetical protein HBI80_114920 [Parastagonospora nodorum]